MKKLMSIILCFTIISGLGLTGCSQKGEVKKTDTQTNNENVEVDKKLLTVEITLPKELLEDVENFNEEEYLKENKGIKSAKLNEDKSLTVVMTKSKHDELVKEMKKGMEDTINELIESEEMAYIKDIKYSKDFKEINILVEKEAYENSIDLTSLMLGISVGMYQAYSGEEFETIINTKDADSGETISTETYPDDFKEE